VMDPNQSPSMVVDKAAAICKLHEMADYCLLGEGTWPLQREGLEVFNKIVRKLGLDEAMNVSLERVAPLHWARN
jgi:hypothetical protein